MSSATKERLIRFFTKYNPDKLPTVDAILEKYAGRDEELFAALVEKYGPEPAAEATGGSTNTRERLHRFFTKYNPEKLPTIDKVMEVYAGRESELFAALEQKYGPEPSATEAPAKAPPAASGGPTADTRARLVRFFTKYNQKNLAQVDAILEKYAGREGDLFSALIEKYGPEPGADEGTVPAAAPTSATGAPTDTKTRLERFFGKYNPEKLPTIPKVMEVYAGREEELFAALVQKYGPEPTEDGAAPAASAEDAPADTQSRLERFFGKYNPEKLPTIPKVMEVYAGREEELFAALVQKYGPEPAEGGASSAPTSPARPAVATAPGDTKTRLERFFGKYNPEKLPTIPKVMEVYAGREEELFAALVQKYGPEPGADADPASTSTSAPTDTQSRLERFFGKYNPEKLPTIPKVMEVYAGREEELFAALVQKYGPEPTVDSTPASPAASGPAAGAPMDTQCRLERFFGKYNPEKLPTIPKVMEVYAGREEELFAALVQKYGPEPVPESAPSTGAAMDTQSRLERFFGKYNPEKLPTIPKVMEVYAGREEELYAALVQKYGPEPIPESTSQEQASREAAPPASPTPASPRRSTKEDLQYLIKQNELDVTAMLLDVDAGKLFATLTSAFGAEPGAPKKPVPPKATKPATSGGQAVPMDTKLRLERMFGKYNPEKLPTIPKVMEVYAGREEELFAALVQKYGPEPAAGSSAAQAPPASTGSPSMDTQSRLERFFGKYNPEKLPTIPKVMEVYAGREEELFAALVQKYGPEPAPESTGAAPAPSSPPTDTKSRLERFFGKYNPEKLPTIPKVMEVYAGREEELFAALVQKYGPEPAAEATPPAGAPTDTKSRLERFFGKYNPEKLPTIPKVMEVYAGREEELFAALVQKYGPEPVPENSAPSAATASGSTPMDIKSRLERFFGKYNPEKLPTIPKVIEVYAGREEELFAALVQKYGPEPAAEAAPPAGTPTDTKTRLERFFGKYNPEKLPTIPKVMEVYAGREEELFAALVQKYGTEETSASAGGAPTDTKSRLERFFGKYNPEKLPTIPKVMEVYAGREEELFAALVQKYGPEPAPEAVSPAPAAEASRSVEPTSAPAVAPQQEEGGDDQATHNSDESRLTEYLEFYDPASLKEDGAVASLLERCGSGDEALRELEGKYGPESEVSVRPEKKNPERRLEDFMRRYELQPMTCFLSLFPSDAEALKYTKKRYGDFENRIRRMLVSYEPEKVKEAGPLLQSIAGKEEQVLRKLVEKHGPEPPRSAPTKIVRLLSKQRSARIEDEVWTDDDDGKSVGDSPVELPVEIQDGHKLLDDAENAPPGEYSGDEGKAYPAEEEYWLRLRFDTTSADEDSAGMRARTYTEFVKPSDEEEPETTPRSESETPRPISDEDQRLLQQVPLVHVASSRGIACGTMCLPCSAKTQKAFDALWTPVGPRHLQMLQSVSASKEGFMEKLSGGRNGNKWQRRYFRFNDKGLHYYDTQLKSEKPKGYKVFTKNSTIIANVDPNVYTRCQDPHFHYVIITVNFNNEEFLLRTTTRQDKEEWVAFLRDSLERLKVTLVGQDPNPARWRARVSGLREAAESVTDETANSSVLRQQMIERREKLKALVAEADFDCNLAVQQSRELDQQKVALQRSIDDTRRKQKHVQDATELRCINAAEDCGRIGADREKMKAELNIARESIGRLREELKVLNCTIIDKEDAKKKLEERNRHVYQKWRQCEERSPTASADRARSSSGLAYRTKGTPTKTGASVPRYPSRKKYSEEVAEKERKVEEAKEAKEKAEAKPDNDDGTKDDDAKSAASEHSNKPAEQPSAEVTEKKDSDDTPEQVPEQADDSNSAAKSEQPTNGAEAEAEPQAEPADQSNVKEAAPVPEATAEEGQSSPQEESS